MKKTILMASMVLGLIALSRAQQAPMYSQYMFNMINVNPAYAGSRGVPTTTMLFRRQWLDIPGSPMSGSITYDDRVDNRNYSWGMQLYYDKVGIEKTTGTQGFFTYHAPLEKATLSLGMSFGMLNYNLDRKRTNPYDVGDPSLQSVINKFLPTAGFGALLSGEKWYVGLSAPALFKTKVMSDGQSLIRRAGAEGHFFLTAGYMFTVSPDIVVKPSTLVKAVSGSPVQFDLNLNVWVKDMIGLGASYRTANAVVGLVEFRLNDRFKLGYAYDYGISNHLSYASGTHEFMLRHEVGSKKGEKITSPRFF